MPERMTKTKKKSWRVVISYPKIVLGSDELSGYKVAICPAR